MPSSDNFTLVGAASDPIHPLAITMAWIAFRLNKSINAPSLEGKQLGAILAGWADNRLRQRKLYFSNNLERCATCAFRNGTTANQCGATLLAALDCLRGNGEFMCHEREDHQCVGYAVLR